jgi:hypothetical protein
MSTTSTSRRHALWTCVVLFAIAFGAQSAQAADAYTSYIVPRVKDRSNRPVAAAVVCVYNSQGRFIAWNYTNSRGVTKFTNLLGGTYYVYAYKAGTGDDWATTVLSRGQGPGRPNLWLD